MPEMDCTAQRIPYRQTGFFSKTVLDYIDQAPGMKSFFSFPPSLAGIGQAIEQRKKFPTNRPLLVEVLKKQYEGLANSEKVQQNISSLLSPDAFTITTAHQNNIFTGPLYFIYKILHAIKLAAHLKESYPKQDFVPVFYMGSEDADLEELNHIYLAGQKLVWQAKQTGAVGRMKIDKELLALLNLMQGQLGVEPHGDTIIERLRECYKEGETLQLGTFRLLNALFGEYGLVVLLPDNHDFKSQMQQVFEDDLLHQTASNIVESTVSKLQQAGYKVQANPREINLFYLENQLRERIEKENEEWIVLNTDIKFSKDQLLKELKQFPERFSPNVILRGLYQETILPNIAFVGGGGELAYWLQLKTLFEHYQVPFPVLILRNSFLLIEQKWQEKIHRLGFKPDDFFLPAEELLNRLVINQSQNDTRLNGSLTAVENMYEDFKKQAGAIDGTLTQHVDALKLRAVYRLQELQKKMLRAEKRKFSDQQRQINAIREHLFPKRDLQERKENFSSYYAKWGKEFIDSLHQHSLSLEQEFVMILEK
jgi:bacillithiol synthase